MYRHFTVVSHITLWHVTQLWSNKSKKLKKIKKNFKKIKKIKKLKNWHVALTLTPSDQTNGENQIESFLRK